MLPELRYAHAQYKLLRERRARCEELVEEVRSLPWVQVTHSEFSPGAPIAIMAQQDRYGIPLRAGICLDSGLIFLVDRLSEEGYAVFYQRFYRPLVSAFIDQTVEPKSIYQQGLRYGQAVYHSIAPWMPTSSSSVPTLLDVGGSTGHVAQIFAEKGGFAATVLDPAPDELQVAADHGLDVAEGFLEHYDAGGQQFDLVLLCQTIDHLLDLPSALKRIYDLVKPGGLFFVDIVDFDEICFQNASVEAALHLDHCYYLTQETARWLFMSLGWEIVQLDVTIRNRHIGFLLRRSERVEAGYSKPLVQERLRTIQRLHSLHAIAGRQVYGMMGYAHRKAYQLKKALLSTFNRNT